MLMIGTIACFVLDWYKWYQGSEFQFRNLTKFSFNDFRMSIATMDLSLWPWLHLKLFNQTKVYVPLGRAEDSELDYCDITWAPWRLKSPAYSTCFSTPFILTNNNLKFNVSYEGNRWPMDSPQTESTMRKEFPWHNDSWGMTFVRSRWDVHPHSVFPESGQEPRM